MNDGVQQQRELELENTISRLEAEKKKLNEELESLRTAYQESLDKNLTLRKRMEELERQIAIQHDEIKGLKEEIKKTEIAHQSKHEHLGEEIEGIKRRERRKELALKFRLTIYFESESSSEWMKACFYGMMHVQHRAGRYVARTEWQHYGDLFDRGFGSLNAKSERSLLSCRLHLSDLW